MRIGRIVIAGLAVSIFDMLVGAVTCGGYFNWVYKVEPTNVWKAMSGPPGVDFMIRNLALNIIFAFSFAVLKNGLPGRNRFEKGLVLGLFVWALGMLPGMNAMYSFMTVAPVVLIYWTILGLVQAPLEGLIIAAIYGDK